jgi:hypothetical protein
MKYLYTILVVVAFTALLVGCTSPKTETPTGQQPGQQTTPAADNPNTVIDSSIVADNESVQIGNMVP